MSQIKFTAKPDFFLVLRNRIDGYFKDNKLDKTGDFRLFSKSIILFSTLIILYTILVFFTPSSIILSILLCVLMGVTLAAIGFNVMHDGAHGSYSTNPTVNAVMGFSLNVMGGNVYIWKQKHNVNHHSYTNIEGMDDDIDIKPFIRVHTAQKKNFMHRFQHFYWILLYGTTYIFWVFYNDFYKYFRGRISYYTPMPKMSTKEHLNFWFSKIFYVILFIVIPGFTVGWIPMLIGYLIVSYITGLLIAVVFQLAHVVEKADFIDPVATKFNIEDEWAIHQLKTTANFATGSKFLNWLLGGLNFQVEHHLFPRVSHIHYVKMNEILKETCQEYNIEYKEYKTMFQALKSHIMHLKAVGNAA